MEEWRGRWGQSAAADSVVVNMLIVNCEAMLNGNGAKGYCLTGSSSSNFDERAINNQLDMLCV